MHAESIMRKFRILTFIIPALALASCSTGDGPESIANTPATPLPDLPPGFCDPINFELDCDLPPITNFASGVTEVIDNPDMSGINTSERVGQMQKFFHPVDLFGGSRLDLASPITFDGADTFQAFTMKVWSSRPVSVLLKAEENTDGSDGIGRPKGHSGSGTWEELCYEFAGADLEKDVLGITVIFDNGVRGAAGLDPANWTFFYDDITRVENCPPGPPTELPVDFENDPFDYNFGPDAGFEGAFASVVANPDPSGINTSAQVARMVKAAAASGETFGGATLQLDTFADVEAGSSFTMKVWASRQVPVLFQPEPQGPGSGVEVIHTGTGWEEMTFPLPALVGTVEGFTIIFDNGTLGGFDTDPDLWEFFFDDITLLPPGSGGGPPPGGGGSAPTTAAPTPTEAAGDVVSLFSNAYTDVTVGDFSTTWDTADVSDVVVDGDDVKQYVPTGGNATLGFIGINFDNANAIDGSGYDTLRLDVWTPDVTNLMVRLVDFGGDGFEGSLADTSGDVTRTLTTGTWQTLIIPFSEFQADGLANLTELSQIILEDLDGASGGTTLYVDNIYFYNSAGSGGGGTAPTVAAPTPTEAAGDVASLFSNAYTDLPVGEFSTGWDSADVSDVVVDGDDVKLYVPTGGNATLGFIGINFDNANAIDGSGYDTLRLDVWTPDVTNLMVRLVDFGGDGFQGSLADTSGDVTRTLTTGTWQTLIIPFSEFQADGLANLTELSQIIIEDLDGAMGGTTLYVDNIYFYNSAGGGGTAPTVAAPTPTAAAGDVASLFSNAYTDLPVGEFSTGWDSADVSDVVVDGDDVKLYVPTGGNATLGFIGINFDNANAIDGSGYDTLRLDVWTPDVTNLMVRLVDFGGDGFQGSLADTSGDVTRTLTTGTWQTLNIPFSEFQADGLANLTELSQIIIEDLDGAMGGTTLYVDNLYFFNSGGSGGGGGGSASLVNGDFETGDLTGWTPGTEGTITVESDTLDGRTGNFGRLQTTAAPQDVLLSQVAIGAGAISPGDTISVSYDLYGSMAGAGGVVFVEVIFLNASGQDVGGRDFVGGGAPSFPSTTWTNYSGDVTAGTAVGGVTGFDVSGGVTLQLKAGCGGDPACAVDAYFDNVTLTIN